MFAHLPHSLLYDVLTEGPLAMVNPYFLCQLSRETKKTMLAVFARPLFWKRLMQTCFPGLATRLPHDMQRFHADGRFASLDDVWHSYMRRAIADFQHLSVQMTFHNTHHVIDLPIYLYDDLFTPNICWPADNLTVRRICSLHEYTFHANVNNFRLNPGLQHCTHPSIFKPDTLIQASACTLAGTYFELRDDEDSQNGDSQDEVLLVHLQEIRVSHYETWCTPFYVPPFPNTRGNMTVWLTKDPHTLAMIDGISPNEMLYDVCVRLLSLTRHKIPFPCKLWCNACFFVLDKSLTRPRETNIRIGDIVKEKHLQIYL